MALRGIRSPKNDQIRSIFYFAERCGGFASQLGGYFRRAVSKGGMIVHHSAQAFGQHHRGALRLARRIAQSVNQRVS